MLNQVADGVWVRQSEWVWSNAVVVRGQDGLVLVDPGIDGSDLSQLAEDIGRLGIPVVAGFSTHPHWDHLLWHPRFGDVPRYAAPAAARYAGETREEGQRLAAESASGIPLELFGLVTPLPADGGPVPGEIVGHEAHATGHAALLLADRGVLIVGDMLSDVLIPILDRRPGQVGVYKAALDRLGEAARHAGVLVPGHGAVAEGPEVAARLAADHVYVDALRRGEKPADARLSQDWLLGTHQSNLEQARERQSRADRFRRGRRVCVPWLVQRAQVSVALVPASVTPPWLTAPMDQTRLLSCLEADCRRIREVAPGRLDERVPTCPDWTVADLVRHVAQVYQHKVEIMRHGEEPEVWPPAGFGTADPLGLLDDSYSEVSREFGSRDPGEACPTFYGPDQTVGFWIRRMAQETAVHRIDAELGAGAAVAPVPGDLAVDGVDELLQIFMGWGFTEWPEDFADALRNSPGHGFLIRAEATADSEAVSWLVRTGTGQLTVGGGPGAAAGATGGHDVAVSGRPAAVLRWAWNREAPGQGSEVTVSGDSDAVSELRACLFEATQ